MKFGMYAKAVVALGGALATFIVTVASEAAITNVLPPAWTVILGLLASMMTGFLTWAKPNKREGSAVQQAFEDADHLSRTLEKAREEAREAAIRAQEIERRLQGVDFSAEDAVADPVKRAIDTARGIG